MADTKGFTIGSEWQQIMQGATGFAIQLKNSCEIEVHYNDSNAEPTDGSPTVNIGNQTNSPRFLSVAGFTKGKVTAWARSVTDKPAEIVVLTT